MIVVGAGVSGLTTAVCIAEAGHRVRIIAEKPPQDTTSAVAGALWEPYLVEVGGRVWDWCRTTLDELNALGLEQGVRQVSGGEASRTPVALPEWGELVGMERWTTPPAGYVDGWRFTAPLVDMPVYLGYLEQRFRDAGGEVESRQVRSFADLDAEVVVNCAGLAARDLVPDPELVPVRGQIVLVENPGITEFFASTDDDSLMYYFPHPDRVVLGGTAEVGEWNTEPDPVTADGILARCAEVEPRLAGARVIAHRVGLRPVRPTIRVDSERLPSGVRLLHNYGHGGAGITVSWGCARDTSALVG